MHLIGINGFKRSGKGETGLAITKLCENVELVGFADKLKILAARTLGYLPAHYSDAECIALMDEAKEKWLVEVRRTGNNHRVYRKRGTPDNGLTMRAYLQNLGNEARGVFGEEFWVDQVLPHPTRSYEGLQHTLYAMYPEAATIAFTDVRYENEAQRIKDLGGIVIEVRRPGTESDGHISEKRLPTHLIDFEIVNDKGLDDLYWNVSNVLALAGVNQ